METISRPKVNLKKGNKENTRPASGPTKSFNKREVPKTVTASSTSHSKINKKEIILGQGEEAQKKLKSGQKDVSTASNAKTRKTLSQAFLTNQAVRHRKLVSEAPKAQVTVPPKPAPGTYKGRVVQSKIGAIWKSSSSLDVGVENKATTKSSVPKVETQKTGNLAKARSKSVADLPGRGAQRPPQSQSSRSKSVSDDPFLVPKCPAASRPTTSRCAGPSAQIAASGTLGRTRSTKCAVVSKGKQTQNSKPKIPVARDKKVNKPPVSSSLSQYRMHSETAEERRAKLAEWLASKGKTLKRPPMSSAAPQKIRLVEEKEVNPSSQTVPEPEPSQEPQPSAQPETEPLPGLQAPEPGSASPPGNDQGSEQHTASASSPLIMNTTLDLLDNSDLDLPMDPEVRMNDVVVNLCDALEAMETPSRCVEESQEMQGELDDDELAHGEPDDDDDDDEEEELSPEHVSDMIKTENVVKRETGGWSSKKVKKCRSEEEEEEEEGSDSDVVMDPTPEAEGAVVKYSVKTTPYLQSVKKTIDGDVSASGSRRKSTIKDLKFLTPVRRSCRIQRMSTRLPGMLADQDPCVSSLAELVQLDDDTNAYIYRKNPALLEELPDCPRHPSHGLLK